MKKLLLVALALGVVAGAEAKLFGGSRCSNGGCSRKERTEERCAKSCLRPACVVKCENNTCEAEMPNLCALTPARVDVIKHVDTNIYYTCAPLGPCQVAPTDEQVKQLIEQGDLPAGVRSCASSY